MNTYFVKSIKALKKNLLYMVYEGTLESFYRINLSLAKVESLVEPDINDQHDDLAFSRLQELKYFN